MNLFREFLVRKLRDTARMPTCAYPGEDLGIDLYTDHQKILDPGEIFKFPTGISVQMRGYGFIIKDRSSISLTGVSVLGGVIDAGYTGEIFVTLINYGSDNSLMVNPGDKIAQMIPIEVNKFSIFEVGEFSPTLRGIKGYGSSGK